jgi:hypothetical protein
VTAGRTTTVRLVLWLLLLVLLLLSVWILLL